MAIKRTSSNSISNAVKLSTGFSSAAIPNSPTIGTATATSDVAATVTYTAAVLGATGSTFTATSNPGSVTGTGSSPITVTGLTASTSYTFSVTAGNANGTSAASSASNSVTTSAPLSSYESIATFNITTSTPSVTFSSIPQTFTHLQLRTTGRTNRAGSDGADIFLKLNSSGTGFYHHILRGTGAAANSYSGTDYVLGGWGMAFTGALAGANMFGVSVCDILDYTNTNKNTTVRSLSGADLNGSGNIALTSSLWNDTSAITSIEVLSNANLQQYTSIALYGIKGV